MLTLLHPHADFFGKGGVKLLKPDVFHDARGWFLESYRREAFAAVGIEEEFVQDNHSTSTYNVLRGLHYQSTPGQAKLVSCSRGSIFDVVVDLRRAAATYGSWISFDLNAQNHHILYVPVGFAHGFLVTSAFADVHYKCSAPYNPDTERGIAWNDPDLFIRWPVTAPPLLSERDRSNPRFRDLPRGKISLPAT